MHLVFTRLEHELFQRFEWRDVTFQEANRPSGIMQEGTVFVSGKHKLYGFKVVVAIKPNGLASTFSRLYSGSVSDICDRSMCGRKVCAILSSL